MRKSLLFIAAILLLGLAMGASAAVVERTYSFTGADLINNVFDGTARYSADGSLKVHEGMRQIGPASGTAVGATFLTGGYLTNFNSTWGAAVQANRVLSTFWLSGNNGYSGQWGEDYKPYAWISGTGPAGWVFQTQTNTSPKAGYHTDQFPVWTTTDSGLSLTSPDLASQLFTVTIQFDTEDMWWGNPNNYLYGCNTAPNSLEGLTMYFGSYFSENGTDINKYVGNMYAEAVVPEPMSMMLAGMGLCSILGIRRLRKL